jgi:hypothetical protein
MQSCDLVWLGLPDKQPGPKMQSDYIDERKTCPAKLVIQAAHVVKRECGLRGSVMATSRTELDS